jgi:UDP-N-acetylglucosamine transferase subunit ALG13
LIFVATGFHCDPFDRLVEWVEDIASQGIFKELFFVQKAGSKVPLKSCRSIDFIEMDRFGNYMTDSRAVITHGGTGSIMTALMAGKRPIVVPRLKKFGEVCNDHQLEIANELQKKNWVYVATTEPEIVSSLRIVMSKGGSSRYERSNAKLLTIVSDYLAAVAQKKSRPRGWLRFLVPR